MSKPHSIVHANYTLSSLAHWQCDVVLYLKERLLQYFLFLLKNSYHPLSMSFLPFFSKSLCHRDSPILSSSFFFYFIFSLFTVFIQLFISSALYQNAAHTTFFYTPYRIVCWLFQRVKQQDCAYDGVEKHKRERGGEDIQEYSINYTLYSSL